MTIEEMQKRREHLLRAWACGMIDRQDARQEIHRINREIEAWAKDRVSDK